MWQKRIVYVVRKGATISDFLGAIIRISAENMIGKRLGKRQCHLELQRPWSLSSDDLLPLALCGQLCCLPHLLGTEQISLTLYCSVGTEDQPAKREEVMTADACHGILPV